MLLVQFCLLISVLLSATIQIIPTPCQSMHLQSQEKQTSDVDDLENSIDSHRSVDCGSIVVNLTSILISNPNYPNPTYTKSICETVVERANPSIKDLNIKFRQLELYRPTYEGDCVHDRFGIYTDLNVLVGSAICGDRSGDTIKVPFNNNHSLILSIMTSDIDHDRFWSIQVSQE